MKNKTLKIINIVITWTSLIGLLFCVFAAMFDQVRLPYIIVGIAFFIMIIDGIVKINHLYWKEKEEGMGFSKQWEKKK